MSQIAKETVAERILIFKEQVVHLPEFSLCTREFRTLRAFESIRMYFVEREIAIDKAQALAKILLQTLDDRVGVAAVRTLIVAVLNQSDAGLAWAFGVIFWPYGDRKSTRLNSSHMSISYAVFCLK